MDARSDEMHLTLAELEVLRNPSGAADPAGLDRLWSHLLACPRCTAMWERSAPSEAAMSDLRN